MTPRTRHSCGKEEGGASPPLVLTDPLPPEKVPGMRGNNRAGGLPGAPALPACPARPFDVPQCVALGDVVPLVVELLPARQPHLELDPRPLEVELQGDHGQPPLLDLAEEV